MCGRTCLTLEQNNIVDACKYRTSRDVRATSSSKQLSNTCNLSGESKVEYIKPEWRSEFNCGRNYTPSYNIAPTDITPVLVAADYFGSDGFENGQTRVIVPMMWGMIPYWHKTRVIVPMMWGMIPYWHKGDYRKHGLTTNNCRLENLMESKLYCGLFKRGQRCVILCEGFYEWQTTKPAKPSDRAAHLIYMPQEEGINIYDKSSWSAANVRLLKMAGLFDVWEDDNGDKIFSYSVITIESSNLMSWLHHRMPAILETEEQLNDWLNYKAISAEKALSLIRPATQLKWHRVSNMVNNSRNKSAECNKPVDSLSSNNCSTLPKENFMMKWLNSKKHRIDTDSSSKISEESSSKRLKTD